MEFMYTDTTRCWPQCNVAQCGHIHCTDEQSVERCLLDEERAGNNYGTAPVAITPVALTNVNFDTFKIAVDDVTGTGVKIDFALGYVFTWDDPRLMYSPCREVAALS